MRNASSSSVAYRWKKRRAALGDPVRAYGMMSSRRALRARLPPSVADSFWVANSMTCTNARSEPWKFSLLYWAHAVL